VVVIGSVNMDLVARTPRLPVPGETLEGSSFATFPGGKGANQAVAAARLGARTALIGRVGNDAFGRQLLARLRAEGVSTRQVKTLPGTSSGVAIIPVEDSGQNSIIIVPGANGGLRPADIRDSEPLIARADAILLQLEIPIRTAGEAIRVARRHRVPVVLDPAPVPAEGLPAAFRGVDVLSPNQAEASALSGSPCGNPTHARAAAATLIERFDPGVVVIKLGAHGAFADAGTGDCLHLPSFVVKVADTTAAGDAFTAALTVRLAEGAGLGEAMRFACAAGALACTKPGAQPAMPDRISVERFLHRSRGSKRRRKART
jgi:ribokinase